MKINDKAIKLGLRFLKENHEINQYLQTLNLFNISLQEAYNEVENNNKNYNSDDFLFTFNIRVYSEFLFNLIPRFRSFIKIKYEFDDYFFKRKVVFQRAVQIYNFVEKYNDELTASFKKLFRYNNINELAFKLLEIELRTKKIKNDQILFLDYYKKNISKYKEDADAFLILCFYYFDN